MRKYTYIFLVVLIVFACMITASAAITARDEDFLGELDIPTDFSFSVQDQCSTHSYFHRAVAQSDGKFAVFSHYIDPTGKSSDTFKRQYVDIYHSDGSLAKEFAFSTTQFYAPALENNRLYLYFYSYVITVDIETAELHCYDIEDAYPNDRNDAVAQQPKTFWSGSWEYRCKKGLNGYNRLIRSNSSTEQVVVDMSGRVWPVWHYVGAVLGAAVITTAHLFFKSYKRKEEKNKKV